MGDNLDSRRDSGGGVQAAYIAQVLISDVIAAKLGAKHPPVMAAEVYEAIVLTRLDRAWWDDDPDRGRRLLVIGRTYAGRKLRAVLYPAGEADGTWWLGTAMYEPTHRGHH